MKAINKKLPIGRVRKVLEKFDEKNVIKRHFKLLKIKREDWLIK